MATINLRIKSKLNQLHAVPRTQQGRQREPSVKTLRSPLSAEFWRLFISFRVSKLRELTSKQFFRHFLCEFVTLRCVAELNTALCHTLGIIKNTAQNCKKILTLTNYYIILIKTATLLNFLFPFQ